MSSEPRSVTPGSAIPRRRPISSSVASGTPAADLAERGHDRGAALALPVEPDEEVARHAPVALRTGPCTVGADPHAAIRSRVDAVVGDQRVGHPLRHHAARRARPAARAPAAPTTGPASRPVVAQPGELRHRHVVVRDVGHASRDLERGAHQDRRRRRPCRARRAPRLRHATAAGVIAPRPRRRWPASASRSVARRSAYGSAGRDRHRLVPERRQAAGEARAGRRTSRASRRRRSRRPARSSRAPRPRQRVGEAPRDGGVLALLPQRHDHELVARAVVDADEDEVGPIEVADVTVAALDVGSTRPASHAARTRPAISGRASSTPRTRWR